MKTIVLYSTRTGNTKKVAEAITSVLPMGTPCVSVKEIPADIASYDCVFLGFWVDRGSTDKDSQETLKVLHNKHVAIFATLGADPKSEHAAASLQAGADFLPAGVDVPGKFICQGAVDPKLIEMMYKQFPAGHPHGKSPERDALHAEAAKHPDAADLEHAKDFAVSVMKHIAEE